MTLLPKNADFTFRGWGFTDSAETTFADTMQKATAQLFKNYNEPNGASFVYQSRYGDVYDECVDSATNGCIWYADDVYSFYLTGSGRLAPGDSGSPIVYNDKIFGVLSQSSTVNLYHSYMSDFTLLMDVFASYINDYVYPSNAGVEYTKGSTSSKSFTVPVQNFKANSVLFTPVAQGTTSMFDVDASDCNATIDSSKGCTISVTFNPTNTSLNSDSYSASVYMTTDLTIPLSATVKTESNSGGGESGGGGSMGGFALFGLLLAQVLRRFKIM